MGIAALAIAGGLAVVGGIAAVSSSDVDGTPDVSFEIVDTTIATPPVTYGGGEMAELFDLSIGDCWAPPASGFDDQGVSVVQRVDCDEPHLGELYAIVDHEFDEYPGDSPVIFDAQRRCIDALEEELDMEYESAPFDVYWIWPSEDSWSFGDRSTLCSYTSLDFSPLATPASGIVQRLPGRAVPVATAESCAQLADHTVGVAEAIARRLDDMTMSELDAHDPAVPLPETERYLKRESTIILRAYEIRCTLAEINDLVSERISSVTPDSLASTALISSIRSDGYYDESLIP